MTISEQLADGAASDSLADCSLYEEALKEADRHKWIQSQQHGVDLGMSAIEQWYRDYWWLYCRSKRLEHLRGIRRWAEFEDETFGKAYRLVQTPDLLSDRVLDQVYAGKENLDIITWAHDWHLPIDRVIEILLQLNINGARLEPRLA